MKRKNKKDGIKYSKREKVLRAIDRLEEDTARGSSLPSCLVMPEDYKKFLIDNRILLLSTISILFTYFLREKYTKNTPRKYAEYANIFRMMCVLEYCKQKGIEV
jgi:hypothetical protein